MLPAYFSPYNIVKKFLISSNKYYFSACASVALILRVQKTLLVREKKPVTSFWYLEYRGLSNFTSTENCTRTGKPKKGFGTRPPIPDLRNDESPNIPCFVAFPGHNQQHSPNTPHHHTRRPVLLPWPSHHSHDTTTIQDDVPYSPYIENSP